MSDFLMFKAEIAKVKRYRGITNKDIARLTGYSESAIAKFLAENVSDRNDSENVAAAISAALDIPLDCYETG